MISTGNAGAQGLRSRLVCLEGVDRPVLELYEGRLFTVIAVIDESGNVWMRDYGAANLPDEQELRRMLEAGPEDAPINSGSLVSLRGVAAIEYAREHSFWLLLDGQQARVSTELERIARDEPERVTLSYRRGTW